MPSITPTSLESSIIMQNRDCDVRSLALRLKPSPELRPIFVLQQIAGYQAAKRKLPSWASNSSIIYPPHISMEQCSSEDTAQYKRQIVRRICGGRMDRFADLTAGFGVDFAAMSEGFQKACCIERSQELCSIISHNLSAMGRSNFEAICADSADFITKATERFSCIFLDPARRDSHGGKIFHIQDCEPNAVEIQDRIMEVADYAIIKLSPMLDISECLNKLRNVTEIHIVATAGECKEMLAVLSSKEIVSPIKIIARNDSQALEFTREQERQAQCGIAESIEPGMYLYEPNAAIMKAGAYKTVAMRFGISKIHPDSHLYASQSLVEDFPGRKFQIVRIGSVKEFRDLKKANIAVRNFPMKPDDLRKKMKLQDGGEAYLFATTIAGERKVVIECRKV